MIKEKTFGASSKEAAKERLKAILTRDRVEISRDTLDSLKTEMVSVAKDYFMVKEHGVEVYLTSMKKNSMEESDTILVCLMPVSKAKLSLT